METSTTARPGPGMTGDVEELQAAFASRQALEDAVARLTQAGFHRSALSMPNFGDALSAPPPQTDTDQRQGRTLATSLAASAGALGAAGVVAATGGAALPMVAAAVAGGVVAGGGAGLATTAAKLSEDQAMATSAAQGELVLGVRLAVDGDRARAEAALRDAGALRLQTVDRQIG